jgi:glycosyltransferase involved in cell wall biosynthesis
MSATPFLLDRERADAAAGEARRVRVVHVIQNLNYGGMERLLADIVRRADPSRFEMHVVALQYLGRFAEGLEAHAGLHVVERMSRWSMLWPAALVRCLAAIAPDVVHTHSGVWHKGSLAARHAGARLLVHTDHGRRSPDPLHARIEDHISSRRTDVVVAVSDVLARQIVETVRIPTRRVRVVRNGVDTELHRPRPDDGRLRRELGLDAGVPIIGSIGRLEPIKGYDVMVEAFARLRERWTEGTPPVLAVSGSGSEMERLRALAAERGVSGAVHLLGWRDDVQELHSTFALFTMSSRSEGTSVSLLEAMSAGLCPVATAVGGTPAVLGDGLRHRLVPADDADALAEGWRDALRDESGRARDARASRARVEERFALDAMVRAYETIYLEALRSGA